MYYCIIDKSGQLRTDEVVGSVRGSHMTGAALGGIKSTDRQYQISKWKEIAGASIALSKIPDFTKYPDSIHTVNKSINLMQFSYKHCTSHHITNFDPLINKLYCYL